MERLRVLVAYEEQYRCYAEAFGSAVHATEPSADVRVARPRDLWEEVSSFEPHLVVSSQATDAVADVGAWYMLSPYHEVSSEFRLGEHRWTWANPDLVTLGRVVKAVRGLMRENGTLVGP